MIFETQGGQSKQNYSIITTATANKTNKAAEVALNYSKFSIKSSIINHKYKIAYEISFVN